MKKHYFTKLVIALILFGAVACGPATPSTPEKTWESSTDLMGPESVLYDADNDIVFVSNVNGSEVEFDGNGFISKLGLDGTITELKWVTGLDAPKGLGRYNNMLYVSDINTLVEIDIAAGEVRNRYVADDAEFLNDVAVDADGNVYVSDMFTDTIYQLSNGEFSTWLQSSELHAPNGLYVYEDQLVIGTWGTELDLNTFETAELGYIKMVSLDSKEITVFGSGTPIGNLDGVEPDGNGGWYVTDWMNGNIFHVDKEGTATELDSLGTGAADHVVVASENLMLVPQNLENKIVAYSLR